MIKTPNKQGIEKAYLNTIKVVYENPADNSIISGEKLKALPLSYCTRQEYPLSVLLFYIVQEDLARAIR